VPLVFLIVLACLRLDRWMRAHPEPRWRAAAAVLALAIAAGVAWHSSVWRVAHLRTLVRERRATFTVRLANADPQAGGDRTYVRTVQGSLALSLAAAGLLLARRRALFSPGGPPSRSPLAPPSTAG
jgi:hypothetical protein